MSRFFGMTQVNSKVILNVYDLHENNESLNPWGLGFYHSGVQVGGKEWTFAGGSGVFSHEPKGAPGVKLRESVEMGDFKGTSSDFDRIIDELSIQFRGNDYHVLNKNCNSFADALLKRLTGKGIPGYVNRMAFFGSFFSCFLPDAMTGQDPTQSGNNSNSNDSSSGVSSSYAVNNARKVSNPMVFSSSSGQKLGGSNSGSSSAAASTSTSTSAAGLADRRERMRAAALNRIQQQ